MQDVNALHRDVCVVLVALHVDHRLQLYLVNFSHQCLLEFPSVHARPNLRLARCGLNLCFQRSGSLSHGRVYLFAYVVTHDVECFIKLRQLFLHVFELLRRMGLNLLDFVMLHKVPHNLVNLLNGCLARFLAHYFVVAPDHLLALLIRRTHLLHLSLESAERRKHLAVEVLQVLVQCVFLKRLDDPEELHAVCFAAQTLTGLHLILSQVGVSRLDAILDLAKCGANLAGVSFKLLPKGLVVAHRKVAHRYLLLHVLH